MPIAFAAAAAALVAASPSAAAPVVQSIERLVPVRPGVVSVSTVSCPAPMVALGGAVVRQPTGSTLRGSMPSFARGWRFRFGGYVGAAGRRARTVVRCVRLEPPAGERQTVRVMNVTRRVLAPALDTGTATLECPRGHLPAAWGFERRPPGAPSPLGPEETQVYRAMAGRDRFEIGLENLGGADERVRIRIRCVEQRTSTRPGALEHSFRIRRLTFNDRVRQGRDVEHHACPRGHFALSAGHQIESSDDLLFLWSFVRRARLGRWIFDESVDAAANVRTQLLCLSLGTRFTRAAG